MRHQFNMHALAAGKLTINWLQQRYSFGRLVAAGGHGIVVEARARHTAMDVVIKFQLNKAEQLVREGSIHRMLTDLWTDNGIDSTVDAPIIKVYDYSQHPAVFNESEFIALVTGGFTADQKGEFALLFNEMAAQDDDKDNNNGSNDDDDDYFDDDDVPTSTKKTVTVSFLVEEKIDATLEQLLREDLQTGDLALLPDVYADNMLRDILAQVLLTLSMLQYMVDFVHGDLHAANVFVRILSRPTVFRYAVARNTVVYVNTRVQVKLGDLGMSMVRVHSPMDERYSMPHGNQIPEHSGYFFQDDDVGVFRPWQDLQRLGGDIVIAIDPIYWPEVVSGGIARVLAAMIDMNITNEVVVTPDMFKETLTADQFAEVSRDVMAGWRKADESRFELTNLLDGMTLENAKDEKYIERLQDLANNFAFNVFNADATHRFPTPQGVFEQTADVWRELFAYMPPNSVTVVDMTLAVGDRTPGTAPAWNLNDNDDTALDVRDPLQPLQPLDFKWLQNTTAPPPEQLRY